jgi:starch-binding outer membrane protein, SusD/RagB family
MRKMNLYKLLLLVGVVSVVSCTKVLQTEPRQSIDDATALNSRDNLNAAITSVYSRLKNTANYGRDLIAVGEALSDNGRSTNKSGRLVPESQNIIGNHFINWQNCYFAIAEINKTLEAIPKLNVIPVVTTAERDNWEGQLYFLRALFYFDLVKVYSYIPGAVVTAQSKGGVPIITAGVNSIDQAVATLPARSPIADVYTLIYADLNLAITKLTNTPSAFPNVATRVAAQCLLSRVALYNKDYATCKTQADAAIASHGSRLMGTNNYVSGWRTSTVPECIFEVRFANNAENIGVNTSLQTTHTTLVVPGDRTRTGGFGDLVPTNTLLAALGITVTGNASNTAAITARTSDVRNLLYEVGTTGRGPAYVECTKYIGKSGFINLDNVPVIRISEMYLNRAEAMATAGSPVFNEAAARADLVTLKSNRYTTYSPVADNALTGAALFNEILLQRRIEFAMEGHRFFDLKRLGLDLLKGPHYFDVAFGDVRILPAIPQRELDGNPNLVQNTGY